MTPRGRCSGHAAVAEADNRVLSQPLVLEGALPRIRASGRRYRKCRQVRARPARPGEEVVTVTADGEETRNRAGRDHLLVQNLTSTGECYLIQQHTFSARYRRVEALDGDWALYAALGEIQALEIDADLLALLGVGSCFRFIAPWGSAQVARRGDMLAAPWPALDEVYRIARREFAQTYRALSAARPGAGEPAA